MSEEDKILYRRALGRALVPFHKFPLGKLSVCDLRIMAELPWTASNKELCARINISECLLIRHFKHLLKHGVVARASRSLRNKPAMYRLTDAGEALFNPTKTV